MTKEATEKIKQYLKNQRAFCPVDAFDEGFIFAMTIAIDIVETMDQCEKVEDKNE